MGSKLREELSSESKAMNPRKQVFLGPTFFMIKPDLASMLE